MTDASSSFRRPIALAGIAGLALLAGCGSTTPTSDLSVARATKGPDLTATQLERQLWAGVSDGLGRLAVMQQPREGAADLGQDLPEGRLRGVSCDQPTEAAGKRSTRCTVRWTTAAGAPERVDYAVSLPGGACFTARADPALGTIYDATIHTYGEHPLDRIYALARGC